MSAQDLSPAMRRVLQACAARQGDALLQQLLPPGAPNVQRTSLKPPLAPIEAPRACAAVPEDAGARCATTAEALRAARCAHGGRTAGGSLQLNSVE
jgi:hypothetical protein